VVPTPICSPYSSVPEPVDHFDAAHPAGQLCEHCGLIAKAGADFEEHVVRFGLEQVRHYRNHQRLRDRLIETDRNWPVQVSARLDLDRHKLVSRHLSHGPKDSLVQPSLTILSGHVVSYHSHCRNHVSSLFLEIFRVHETPHSSDISRRYRSVIPSTH